MSRQEILLSPLDQHGPGIYTRMALVFPVTDYEPAIADLQSALNKTCDQLPYLKGRVSAKDISERKQSFLTMDPSDPTPQLEERPTPHGVSSYAELKANRTPFPPAIFPLPAPTAAGAPVIGGSYTKISGGLVLCIVTHHKVLDGTGYSEILRLIAHNALTLSSDSNSPPPNMPDPNELPHRRQRILGGATPLVPDAIRAQTFEQTLAHHPEYTLRSLRPSAPPPSLSSSSNSPCTNRVFAFSLAKITAARHALSTTLPQAYLSVNNILTAVLWASITHIRRTRPVDALTFSATSKMDFPVSGRHLVGASLLEPPFLGNAICYALAERGVDALSFIPDVDDVEKLGAVVTAVAGAAAHLTAAHMASVVHLSDVNPDLTDLTMAWLFNGAGDVHFISWAQVGVYELDFGGRVGRPGYMRSAFMKLDGVVNFLPRRRTQQGDEEMEVSVLLREDDMERLAGNAAWRRWLVDE